MADDAFDNDRLLRQALEEAARPRPDGSSPLSDFTSVVRAMQWPIVLAAPRYFRNLPRIPTAAHLVDIMGILLAYVQRNGRNTTPTFQPVPYERREPLAIRLRDLLEKWVPPDLPSEVTMAARDFLYAEGFVPPGGWENMPDPEIGMDQYLRWLLWPEDLGQLGLREGSSPT